VLIKKSIHEKKCLKNISAIFKKHCCNISKMPKTGDCRICHDPDPAHYYYGRKNLCKKHYYEDLRSKTKPTNDSDTASTASSDDNEILTAIGTLQSVIEKLEEKIDSQQELIADLRERLVKIETRPPPPPVPVPQPVALPAQLPLPVPVPQPVALATPSTSKLSPKTREYYGKTLQSLRLDDLTVAQMKDFGRDEKIPIPASVAGKKNLITQYLITTLEKKLKT
jgi:hypothetical protein